MDRGISPFIFEHPMVFRRRVYRGIPAMYRWEVWKAVVRVDDRAASCPGLYQELQPTPNEWTKQIEIDVPRTFPDLPSFGGPERQMLLRILHTYANLNPDVGYCQGMNFVAGLLLLVSNFSEEDTFWMFVCMMDDRNLNGFYKEKFPLLQSYLSAFDQMVAETIPDLRDHFVEEGVQPAVYLHQWFLSVFVNCLPLPTVLIIWDVIMVDGFLVILPIALSLLKVLKHVLMPMPMEEIVRFLKAMKAGEEECDASIVGQLLVKQSHTVEMPPHISSQLCSLEDGGCSSPLGDRSTPRAGVERWAARPDLGDSSRANLKGAFEAEDSASSAPSVLGYFGRLGDIGGQVNTWWEDARGAASSAMVAK